MNIIVAADKNWAIGRKNELLVRIPNDMRVFQRETLNKVVVMGRKTFESLPNKQPLLQRTNIVMTRNKGYKAKGVTVVDSMKEILKELEQYNSEDIYIIGGADIYKQFLPYCDIVHLTKINYVYDADAYFCDLDKSKEWKIVEESDEHTYFDIEYQFIKYKKV